MEAQNKNILQLAFVWERSSFLLSRQIIVIRGQEWKQNGFRYETYQKNTTDIIIE